MLDSLIYKGSFFILLHVVYESVRCFWEFQIHRCVVTEWYTKPAEVALEGTMNERATRNL